MNNQKGSLVVSYMGFLGLSPLQVKALNVSIENCVCGHPQCLGLRTQINHSMHAIGGMLDEVPRRDSGVASILASTGAVARATENGKG